MANMGTAVLCAFNIISVRTCTGATSDFEFFQSRNGRINFQVKICQFEAGPSSRLLLSVHKKVLKPSRWVRSLSHLAVRGLKRWDEGRWGNPKIRVLI